MALVDGLTAQAVVAALVRTAAVRTASSRLGVEKSAQAVAAPPLRTVPAGALVSSRGDLLVRRPVLFSPLALAVEKVLLLQLPLRLSGVESVWDWLVKRGFRPSQVMRWRRLESS